MENILTVNQLSKHLKIGKSVLLVYIRDNIPGVPDDRMVISEDQVNIIKKHHGLKCIGNFFVEKGYKLVYDKNNIMRIQFPKNKIKKTSSKGSSVRTTSSGFETKRSKH